MTGASWKVILRPQRIYKRGRMGFQVNFGPPSVPLETPIRAMKLERFSNVFSFSSDYRRKCDPSTFRSSVKLHNLGWNEQDFCLRNKGDLTWSCRAEQWRCPEGKEKI